ncbi:hypothetical protein TsFJ059_005937 [Trichoderma semiorbis]|uniref:Uncharacterized protein n=1 Tax=Trichoderma semiorbis TaxID=1491008 RepID=A0A9P8HIE1_9HYPO|nr:hypothetical protein TsFJ059_005937 [Trichoderma semiorbis]
MLSTSKNIKHQADGRGWCGGQVIRERPGAETGKRRGPGGGAGPSDTSTEDASRATSSRMKMSTAGCADQQEEDPVAFGRGCELRDEQKEQGQGGGSAGGSSSSSRVWTRKPHKLWTKGGVH